jgi:hypothetical protein
LTNETDSAFTAADIRSSLSDIAAEERTNENGKEAN